MTAQRTDSGALFIPVYDKILIVQTFDTFFIVKQLQVGENVIAGDPNDVPRCKLEERQYDFSLVACSSNCIIVVLWLCNRHYWKQGA